MQADASAAQSAAPPAPQRDPLARAAWLPLLAGLAAIALLAAVQPQWAREVPPLFVLGNLVFIAAAGAMVALVAARAYLATGEHAVLLLAAGAAAWAAAGLLPAVSALAPGDFQPNTIVTLHNMAAWLAGALHLGAVALGVRGGGARGRGGHAALLAVALAAPLGALLTVMALTEAGAMPRFFVPGLGGTTERQFVVTAAIAMFALCGGVMLAGASRPRAWYGLALLLLAAGLLAALLQQQNGDALNWLARGLQYLGGVYLLIAAGLTRRVGAAPLSLALDRAPPGVWIVFTVAVVTGAAVLRVTVLASLGANASYLVFLAAVMVAAQFGGLRAGALANGLSLVVIAMFLEPAGLPWVDSFADVSELALFALIGLALSYIAEAMQRAQARSGAAAMARVEAEQRALQFRSFAESIPQFAWMAGPDGRPVWCNRRWFEYTGLSSDLNTVDLRTVHDPALYAEVRARWRDCVAHAEPFEMVFPIRGRDGQFRQFLTRGVPVLGPDGRVAQWFGTNTDVTEARRVEETLRLADRRKDEFLATLAHELRNPMAPIRTATEILRVGGDDAGRRAYAVAVLQRQVAQLARLMDDLLDLSRITTGKLQLRLAPTDFAAAARAALETCQPALDARAHLLELDLPAAPVTVDGDAARLTQIVANLVSNAVKFTPSGGRIAVRLRRERGQAVLQVSDDGAGIPPERLHEVFDMFIQLHAGMSQGEGGLGIGLHLVRRLVEMHGGQVGVASDGPGRGSVFEVRLPATQDLSRPLEAAAPPERAHRRVLVVDDNRDAGETLCTMLQLQGHEVHVEHDGAAGLAAALRLEPDALLLDLGMPGMDGLQVAARLRATAAGTRMAIVAISGWGQEEDRRRTREAGFDAHLTKPVDPEELGRTLAALCGTPAR